MSAPRLFRFDNPAFLIALFGLIFTGLGARAFWYFVTDPATEPVQATVTLSRQRMNPQTDSRRNIYAYDFEYRYEYAGKTYTSDRYHYQTGSNFEAVKSLRPGQRIQAWVDPDNPAQSIVVKGWSWLNLAWLIVGLVLLIAPILMHRAMSKLEDPA